MQENDDMVYPYPKFITNKQIMKGLYMHEWAFVAAPSIFGLLIAGPTGLLIGAMITFSLYGLLIRYENKRFNLFNEIMWSCGFFMHQQAFIKRPRDEIEENDDDCSEDENETAVTKKKDKKEKKGKKKNNKKNKNKKEKQKKEKNMQELFPFKKIEDSYIEMENGDIFIYMKIQANCLDLLSHQEISKIIREYGRDIDRDKLNVSYFIQDGSFNINDNIKAVNKAKETQANYFLRNLLDQEADLLKDQQANANRKFYCLRIYLKKGSRRQFKIEDIISRTKEVYRESLNPEVCTRDDIKYMLAVFGNRIFSDNIPDYEISIKKENRNRNFLIKKKQTYEDLQLPGVYEFKDLITPITANFTPSEGHLGVNIVKTYTIASFLGGTKETNLLSKVCNIPGVTTSIYIEPLPLRKYKSNMRQELRSQRSSIKDDVDQLDFQYDTEAMSDAYKRSLKDNLNMYYISVYFMLTAKNKEDFEILEQSFLDAIDDVSITLDDMKSRQKECYLSVSPIGTNLLGKWIKQNIPSISVANLYPFNEPSLLDPKGLYIGHITDKDNPMLFSPFTYRGSNNNILILGMSGIGKTVLLMTILQNSASMNAYIRNIDFEGTQSKFIERIGGINIDIAGGNDFAINILQVRIPDEIRVGILDDYIGEVKNWARIYKQSWSDNLLDLFEEFLKRAYAKKNITNQTNFSLLRNTDYPILSDVYKEIEIEWENFDESKSLASKDELRNLLLGLKSAIDGADSYIFNRHTYLGEEFTTNEYGEDVFRKTHVINFDFSRMMNSDKPRKLAQWTNIFTFITQFVNNNMSMKDEIIVSIDELHELLHKENLPIVNIISSYERRFRKRNACFLKATQTIDEVDNNDPEMQAQVKPLFSQSAVKFLFHLGDADYDQPKKLLALSDFEIKKLRESRSGKCLMRVNKSLYDLDVFMPDWFKEVKPDVKSIGQ